MFKIIPKQNFDFACPRNFSVSRCLWETHYEILKLTRNCSAEDVRSSFLKLSKKYHPDRNKSAGTHVKFVQILEAYKILSKPGSRRNYDLGLSTPYHSSGPIHVRYEDQGRWMDETLWQYRDKSKDKYYQSKPYYGINGLKRLSNLWIVIMCLSITTIGVSLQILAIRHSLTLNREEMNKKSSDLEELHSQIRATALLNGDKKQLEILKQRMNYKVETK